MRSISFVENEFYHVYNRGVEKRDIVVDEYDSLRFLQSLKDFNTINPIGSIYENSFSKSKKLGNLVSKSSKKGNGNNLVNIICYCLNPNHFHLVLEQVAEKGIEKFMHRLGLGYAKYFNNKYKRSGSLFQGTFKAVHVDSNDYLLHLSAYVSLNNKVHKLGNLVSKLIKSSWGEYIYGNNLVCNKDIILSQFKNIDDYKVYCEETLLIMLKNKEVSAELKLLEAE